MVYKYIKKKIRQRSFKDKKWQYATRNIMNSIIYNWSPKRKLKTGRRKEPWYCKRMTIDRMTSRNDILMDTPFKFSLHIFHGDFSHARGRMRLWKVWGISPQFWTELLTLPYIINLRNYISSNNLLSNTRILGIARISKFILQ